MGYKENLNAQGVVDRFDEKQREVLILKKQSLRKKYNDLHVEYNRLCELFKAVLQKEDIEKQIEYDQKTSDIFEKAMAIDKEIESINRQLLSFDSLGVSSNDTLSHIPQTDFFSIGDYCGRIEFNKNKNRITYDQYHDTSTADFVNEGSKSNTHDLIDYIDSKEQNMLKLVDILAVDNAIFQDDSIAIKCAFDSTHNRRVKNTENKKVLDILISQKESVNIVVDKLNEIINQNLAPQAKPFTEIWTNQTGFSELDKDVNGVSLIKINSNGEFVYKEKYIIREFDDTILKSTDQGAPVLIGDFKHILKFLESKPRLLYNETVVLNNDISQDRFIKEVLPIVMDNSNKSYILGYLNNEEDK